MGFAIEIGSLGEGLGKLISAIDPTIAAKRINGLVIQGGKYRPIEVVLVSGPKLECRSDCIQNKSLCAQNPGVWSERVSVDDRWRIDDPRRVSYGIRSAQS